MESNTDQKLVSLLQVYHLHLGVRAESTYTLIRFFQNYLYVQFAFYKYTYVLLYIKWSRRPAKRLISF